MTAPIDPNHHEAMNLIAKNLDDQFNPLRHMTGKRITGFMLTVFDFDNPDSRFNYISNADKLDVRRMLQDVLARLDHRAGQNTEEMVVVPRAEITRLTQELADARALIARASLSTHMFPHIANRLTDPEINDWKDREYAYSRIGTLLGAREILALAEIHQQLKEAL